MLEMLCLCLLVQRLAEKYSESQTTKEKIQKSIEVKKEHLSSLQPGLNAIMQVSCRLTTPSAYIERRTSFF